MDISITTKLNTYTFLNEWVPNWTQGFQFFGFSATSAGEVITSFLISSNGGLNSGH